MMNYAVYWEPETLSGMECCFYPTLEEAQAKMRELILECGQIAMDDPEHGIPNWAITLLQQLGEVRQIPFGDGSIAYFPNNPLGVAK